MSLKNHLWLLCVPPLLAGCARTVETQSARPAPTAIMATACSTPDVTLDTEFLTGNIASCEPLGDTELSISIEPEDAPPINCSAWYAFRLTPQKAETVTVNLTYEHCGHRYWPKSSSDGITWTDLPQDAVEVYEVDGVRQARITLALADQPLFIAGQEIISSVSYRQWIDRTAASPFVETWSLGQSAEGRDIPALTIKSPASKPREQIVLVGRQHPPEVTGALAMMPFVETLLSDEPLARRFRERFETIVVPMLNPDGVDRGYWRHNSGSTDLNRDWGPFVQPETRLMDALLGKIETDRGRQLRLFVDFHSTQNDIFYTIPDESPTNPPLFLKSWLDRLQARMPDYKVNRDANHNLGQANSKNHVYKTYGAPTVTFEIGDETDRQLIIRLARESAIAMMESLLNDG
ncbi:succinylglutamate desuccinylase/aspartoacylase family protein [Parasphingorhabdus flavimaris]|uniref:Succinylglutamate desuccinylase/aspartoacylase family protein n=1 Tax=Parasphingorhabdus flavimaris TaxID=266812 RepID=A0ABX2N422_9SPHN|nr:M14 family zinc carboxypeptidase [Parasphingorhabdus flavimaris]NVD28432.1 succinylglutamate desuccinylase/aspartoacylase family protein [Parasphingorhabdus flavimaris]|tara:strand:- start:9820 stop:11037 length:1218 start_codon:yes stop_codon:yes gene_type:complete